MRKSGTAALVIAQKVRRKIGVQAIGCKEKQDDNINAR
jgi:hypothetical protein